VAYIETAVGSAANITMRLLDGEPEEMAALQTVFEESSVFAERLTGLPFGPAEAQSVYTVLPENVSYEKKLVFGLFSSEIMIGCIDLIVDFPQTGVGAIGLLLICESAQGKGFGRAAYRLLEDYMQRKLGCRSARVSVARRTESKGFWIRMGFSDTGESKPYSYANITSVSDVLIRSFTDSN
jgi:ribosomal protein S18 acetylase RimI-like enzyme